MAERPNHSDSLTIENDLLEARVHEADDPPENGKHIVEVTLIREGVSTNSNFYGRDLLRSTAPLFEGARAFADHQRLQDSGQPRSVRDLVGHYRHVNFVDDPSGGKIRADFHLLPGNDWLWHIIQEAQAHPNICGLSIDAKGEIRMGEVDGRRVRVVEAIRSVNSIDIVSKPAAGGTLDRILASEDDGSDHGYGIADERPVMESDLSQADRERFATVVRTDPDGSKTYKFPIPPAGHPDARTHAEQALRLLNTSDLTDAEKAKVERAARAVLDATTESTHQEAAAVEQQTDLGAGDSRPAGTVPTQISESELDPVSVIQQLQKDREEKDRELQRLKEALLPSVSAPVDANATAADLVEQVKRERAEFERELDLAKCHRLLESALASANLPQPIAERVRKRYQGKIFSEVSLTEDINDERDVLGRLTDSGRVIGHGTEKVIVPGMSEYEQIQAAFDGMFDLYESDVARSVPRLTGIREAFRYATGVDITGISGVDRPLQEAYQVGLRNYVRHKIETGQLTEAEYHLREADVQTSTFSYLLGTSMNKRLLKDYQAWPSEWQKFVNTVAIKDFKQQDRIRLGAFGSLSTVSEDAAYTTLTLADTHATYSATKRGNLVQITRETIINDDLYAIKQIPQKLAVAAAFTLAEFVYGLLDPGGASIYDGHSLFDATNHKNTGIVSGSIGTAGSGTALSSAAMQTGVIAMRKQTNAASKPIGLKPRFLLVPPDLEFTAMNILKSAGLPGGSNNDINPMMGYAEPIVAPQVNSFTVLGATTTFSALIADPRVIDTIELGFIGGQVNPVLFIQDAPLYGINFTQDVISYKVRHEYGGAVVDYRGFYLINN